MGFGRVRVGDVLELLRRPVSIDLLAEYVSIGVRSFGKGVFHYEPKTGAELSKLRYFEVQPNELVVSNIKAWEGAIAVSSDRETGCIASNRFLTYVPKNERVDVSYLRYLFLSDTGLPLVQRASPGSADRNRTLAIDRFEALQIPLPDLAEQRRIVARLDVLLSRAQTARVASGRAAVISRAAAEAAVQKALDDGIAQGWPVGLLGDVALVNPPPARLSSDDSITFVPMSAVDDRTGTIARPQVVDQGELKSTYKQFRRGDVIFARITPCMQNGKSAAVDDIPTEYGYGSTEFHVLRPADGVTKEWIHRVVRTRGFRERAATRFTGTAGQQRVPADFLRQVQIPVPNSKTQERVVEYIDRVAARALDLDRLYQAQVRLLEASEKSILNHAFAGGL